MSRVLIRRAILEFRYYVRVQMEEFYANYSFGNGTEFPLVWWGKAAQRSVLVETQPKTKLAAGLKQLVVELFLELHHPKNGYNYGRRRPY